MKNYVFIFFLCISNLVAMYEEYYNVRVQKVVELFNQFHIQILEPEFRRYNLKQEKNIPVTKVLLKCKPEFDMESHLKELEEIDWQTVKRPTMKKVYLKNAMRHCIQINQANQIIGIRKQTVNNTNIVMELNGAVELGYIEDLYLQVEGIKRITPLNS